ncbi:MAG: PAS domain S-box protein [Actinobacteria bacterium]|nr:PAS domain S-box protein [Actinomycetota bacterium]
MKKSKHVVKRILFLCIVIHVVVDTAYLYYSWNNYRAQAKNDAIGLAQSAAALIDPNQILTLKGTPEDIESSEYQMIKNGLMDFKTYNDKVSFAYITMLKDGKIYFLVDSESPLSEDYSPPGQEYSEAGEQDKLPFFNGEALLTAPAADRWGTWVSALVPIRDAETGKVIAVFGIDYPEEYWNAGLFRQVMQDATVVVSILLLLIGLYRIYRDNINIGAIGAKLAESETLFKTVFEQAPVGVAIVTNYFFFSEVNSEFARILGRSKEDITSLNWVDITHPDDLEMDMEQYERFKAGEISGYSLEKRYIRPDGTDAWIYMVIAGIHIVDETSGYKRHIAIIQDINERKIAEENLRESERSKSMLLSNLPGMAYRCEYDSDWTMQFLSEGCHELTGYEPESLIDNNELPFEDLIAPEYRDILWNEWTRTLKLQAPFRHEYEIITKENERKWVLEIGQGVFGSEGAVEALEGIVIDITESKKRLDEIRYISEHDYTTGLYNRKQYETEKRHLDNDRCASASIIKADINGVRLINDAFGHAEGDRLIVETARIMQSCCREGDILARTGGDDFSMLLPNTGHDDAYELVNAILAACENYNLALSDDERPINLSIGFGTTDTEKPTLDDAEKEAEEYLRTRKLFERESYHSALLSSVMATMYARSQETEEHAIRIAELCKIAGKKMNLTQQDLDELQLFSMLHDVGKVGIDDHILNKPGRLTDEEWVVMKAHPEIGYRIAMSVPELKNVAEYILTHHERWDGCGYPQGMRGEEIPLLSRILAVADSYDAMTEDRVYRKALSRAAAIEEIEKNAGLQFDPAIVRIFIEIMQEPMQDTEPSGFNRASSVA